MAAYFEDCGCTVGGCHSEFGFAGAAVADSDGESGAVSVTGGVFLDDFNLYGMESENLLGKEESVTAINGFTVVGINQFPLPGIFSRNGFGRKRKFK